jgi:hypothetical protein
VVAERPESVASGRRVTRGPARQRNLRGVHPDPETLLSGYGLRCWPCWPRALRRPRNDTCTR